MIANTHYNQIDTLIAFIGAEKWEVIEREFFNNIREADTRNHFENVSKWIQNNRKVGISSHMEQHQHYSRMFQNHYVDWETIEEEIGFALKNPVRYTLSELFVWAMTEGQMNFDWGYGFRRQ